MRRLFGIIISIAMLGGFAGWAEAAPVNIIEILRPNAAGDETNYPNQYPDTGEHWDKVDDEISDEGSTWIGFQGQPGNPYYRDLFNIEDLSSPGDINKVTVYARVWRIYQPTYCYLAIKPSDTVYESPRFTISSGYPTYPFQTYSYEWTTNPDTGFAWTWSEINNLQAGIRQNSWYIQHDNFGTAKCTQLYVEVDYDVNPIPEPTSLLLLGFGVVGIALFKRRLS